MSDKNSDQMISVGTDWVEKVEPAPLITVCGEVSQPALTVQRLCYEEITFFREIISLEMMMTEAYNPLKRQQDLQTLTNIIVSWNSTRLDLFELTLPNEDLEFSGK